MKVFVALVAVVGAALLPWFGSQAGATGSRHHAEAVAPEMLAVAPAVFSPAKVIKSSVDPNSQNTNPKVWPRDEHSKDYPSLGRVDGYYQAAHWNPAAKQLVHFEYDGSIYGSPDQAVGAWQDGSTYDLKYKNLKKLNCPSALGSRCTRLSLSFTGGSWEIYDVIQQGRCTSEARAKGPKDVLFKTGNKTVLRVLSNVDHAAFAAMTSHCG